MPMPNPIPGVSDRTYDIWFVLHMSGGTPEGRRKTAEVWLQERGCPADEVQALLDYMDKDAILERVERKRLAGSRRKVKCPQCGLERTVSFQVNRDYDELPLCGPCPQCGNRQLVTAAGVGHRQEPALGGRDCVLQEYTDLELWLTEARRRKTEGHELLSSDIPGIGFQDDTDGTYHSIPLWRVKDGLVDRPGLGWLRTPGGRQEWFVAPSGVWSSDEVPQVLQGAEAVRKRPGFYGLTDQQVADKTEEELDAVADQARKK